MKSLKPLPCGAGAMPSRMKQRAKKHSASKQQRPRALLLKIICIILSSVFVLVSCGENDGGKSSDPNGSKRISGRLTVYSDPCYRSALERIFRTAGGVYSALAVEWTGDADSADLLITDTPPSDGLMPIDSAVPDDIISNSLLRKSGENIVGIPLFLHIDSIWYDTLFYDREKCTPPYNYEDLQKLSLAKQFPAVCPADDPELLFWAAVAPLYLANGGSSQELTDAKFDKAILEKAIGRLSKLRDEGLLSFTPDAVKAFTSARASALVCSFAELAEAENSMSSLSEETLAPSLFCADGEQAFIVVRADTVSVRQTADRACALAFLELLFEPKNLINLLSDTHIPLACKISYGSRSIPENVQHLYEALASNLTETVYISENWDDGRADGIYEAVGLFGSGRLSAEKTAERLCSDITAW